VAKIRTYWNQMKNLSPAERFYTTLKDDTTGTDQWLQAAGNIVQPTDVETHGGWTNEPKRKPGQKIILRGEKLRDGRTPSVSRLLAQRSDELAALYDGSSYGSSHLLNASQLALDLAVWDKTAAVPLLQKRLKRILHIDPQPSPLSGNPVETYGRTIVKLTDALARCGDETAYDNYATWIQKADFKNVLIGYEELQKPLLQGAARPRIKQAMDYLFNDPQSVLSQPFTEDHVFDRPDFWKSSLPTMTQFRQKAFRMLSDKNPAGTITFNPREKWKSEGEAQIKMEHLGLGFVSSNNDPDTPPPGQPRSFRVCDVYAYFYSQYQNGPKIQLFWPQKKRDAAVAECRKWLEKRG
jgi:hypothetical protein